MKTMYMCYRIVVIDPQAGRTFSVVGLIAICYVHLSAGRYCIHGYENNTHIGGSSNPPASESRKSWQLKPSNSRMIIIEMSRGSAETVKNWGFINTIFFATRRGGEVHNCSIIYEGNTSITSAKTKACAYSAEPIFFWCWCWLRI